ncbi:hypothetical protein [Bartonella gliris]|uniref:hypothetical protein n=1 Tax=Bartonella gliris TaxID=3004109 RepID=UPI00295F5390|nr:hypothetical protein [Bartonella gliris]
MKSLITVAGCKCIADFAKVLARPKPLAKALDFVKNLKVVKAFLEDECFLSC